MDKPKNRTLPPHAPLGEEIANSITHGVGALLSLLGTGFLLYRAAVSGTALHVVSFSIYGASLFLLYLSSTLYHALRPPAAGKYSGSSTTARSTC